MHPQTLDLAGDPFVFSDHPRHEPIRKPERCLHLIKNYQRLAQRIDAPIVCIGGQVFTIAGQPSVDALLAKLIALFTKANTGQAADLEGPFTCDRASQLERFERAMAAIDPSQLSFDHSRPPAYLRGGIPWHDHFAPLPLEEIAASLDDWETLLSQPDKSLRKIARRDRRTIMRLRQRIDAAQQLAAASKGTAAFLLSSTDEVAILQIVAGQTTPRRIGTNQSHDFDTPRTKLSDFEFFLVRFVYWHSGQRAAERYFHAVTRIRKSKELAELRATIAWLDTLIKHSHCKSNSQWIGYELKTSQVFQDLIRWLKKTPGMPWERCAGPLPTKLMQFRRLLVMAFFKLRRQEYVRLPATLAVWTICDQADAELPWLVIAVQRHSKELTATCEKFIQLAGHSHYDQLFALDFDSLYSGNENSLQTILRLFERGGTADDIALISVDAWAHWIGEQVKPQAAAKAIRQAKQLTTSDGISRPEFGLHLYLAHRSSVVFLLDFFAWLKRFPEHLLDQPTRLRIENMLSEWSVLFASEPFRQCVGDIMAHRQRVKPRRRPLTGESAWPRPARIWLRELAFFQTSVGQPVRLPKRLANQRDRVQKVTRELEFLQTQFDRGQISATQLARLNYLKSKPATGDSDSASSPAADSESKRKVRIAQESCLLSGLENLQTKFQAIGDYRWRSIAGTELPPFVADKAIRLASWAESMSANDQRLLRETCSAWSNFGAGFKAKLEFNARWLAAAQAHGVCVPCWLNPPATTIDAGGVPVKLFVAQDPNLVYQMGTYFGTCLSQRGCNEMAVLANAAHANKQVVFASLADGTAVGRQLIAINRDFKLVGFHNYVNCDGVLAISSDELIAHFARFAGQLSRRANVELDQSESPADVQSFESHFWYDDGTHPWHDAARSPIGPRAAEAR